MQVAAFGVKRFRLVDQADLALRIERLELAHQGRQGWGGLRQPHAMSLSGTVS